MHRPRRSEHILCKLIGKSAADLDSLLLMLCLLCYYPLHCLAGVCLSENGEYIEQRLCTCLKRIMVPSHM
jgi:hypothetical protein